MKKMNSKEFLKALEVLTKEKGIKEDTIYEAMELALASAYRKHTGSLTNVKVNINKDTGDIKLYSYMTVVDEVENPEVELSLEEASKLVPGIKVGETIDTEVDMKSFGRVAAATAKQVIVQKVREAERNTIMEEYGNKVDEMVLGTVSMEDQGNYYIDLGRTQGVLPKKAIIPGEEIKMGSTIKVYITKVDSNSKGLLILLSRTHHNFIKRLFELEIPEINEGIVLVYGVAREAGKRSKIAVYSEDPKVDAIGACIGEKGSRIANILKELGNEKIDIVEYSKDPAKFIENALKPAKNVRVFITDDKNKDSIVIVDDDNLALAIGKKGLNINLANKLTKYNIDIKTYEQAKEEGINILEG